MIINEAALQHAVEHALELRDIELFRNRKDETLTALEACMEKHTVPAGGPIFLQGNAGDELFLIRRGAVRILLPVNATQNHHLGTFGRGAFFGEMGFLDGAARQPMRWLSRRPSCMCSRARCMTSLPRHTARRHWL